MISPRIKSYITHYLYGLFAAGWNGAWNATAGIVGIDAIAMTGATNESQLLTSHQMLAAFVSAFVIHAALWIKTHPIPDELPVTTPPFSNPSP